VKPAAVPSPVLHFASRRAHWASSRRVLLLLRAALTLLLSVEVRQGPTCHLLPLPQRTDRVATDTPTLDSVASLPWTFVLAARAEVEEEPAAVACQLHHHFSAPGSKHGSVKGRSPERACTAWAWHGDGKADLAAGEAEG
jgi:hypothetical protein